MKQLIALVALLLPIQLWAAIDTYEFKDEATRERFKALTEELRCPKCQNQNLADSNSPIAKDLRNEVYRMVGEDQSDDEIVDFMVARYGDFVLYRPRMDASTYVLWYGPFVLLAFGALVVFMITRRKRKAKSSDVAEVVEKSDSEHAGLSETDQQRLNAILKQDDNK